jgi:hypothetical protein
MNFIQTLTYVIENFNLEKTKYYCSYKIDVVDLFDEFAQVK